MVTFIRRWGQEQDFSVAKALGKAICNLMEETGQRMLRLDVPLVLAGFYRWFDGVINEDILFLQHCLQMIKLSMSSNGSTDRECVEKHLAMEICMANALHADSDVSHKAKSAILEITNSNLDDDIAHAIATNDPLFFEHLSNGLQKNSALYEASAPVELSIREQSGYNLLSLLSESNKLLNNDEIAHRCLELAVLLLGLSSKRFTVNEDKQLRIIRCMEYCASNLSSADQLPKTIASLCSLSKELYEKVSIRVLEAVLAEVVDDQGVQLSPVAYLFEFALSDGCSSEEVCRLIELATKYACNAKTPAASFPGLIPAMALLENDHDRVRQVAANYLSKVGERFNGLSSDWIACGDLADMEIVYNETLRKLTKKNAFQSLSSILSHCVDAEKGESAQKVLRSLLRLCTLTARVLRDQDPLNSQLALPSAQASKATIDAVSTILQAMELAGERNFPLKKRWMIVGHEISRKICDLTHLTEVASYRCLAKSVIKMLKGRYLADTKTITTFGPGGTGGRTRSYSLGTLEDVKTVESYPSEMSKTLLCVLRSQTVGGLEFASLVVGDLFLDAVWVDRVFARLDVSTRLEIITAIVELVERSDTISALFTQLPFDLADVHGFLAECTLENPLNLSAIVSVSNFITSNAESTVKSKASGKVVDKLFEGLTILSSTRSDYNSSDFEFTCQSMVAALDVLCGSEFLPERPSKVVKKCFSLMIMFQAVNANNLFSSKKYRLSALGLATTLAEKYPAEGIHTLYEGFKVAFENKALDALSQTYRVQLLSKMFSVFWNNYNHFPFERVLHAVATNLPEEEAYTTHNLSTDVVLSLLKSPDSENISAQKLCCGGALASVLMALHKHPKALEVMLSQPRKAKLPSLVLMFQYTSNLIIELSDDPMSEEQLQPPLPSHKALARIITQLELSGDSRNEVDFTEEQSRFTLLHYALGMTRLLCECLQMSDIQKLIAKGTGEEARCCLLLWQGVIWLYAVTQSLERPDRNERELWHALNAALGNMRDELQLIMPVTLFLASVSSMLEDGSRSETLSQTLGLLAERVSDIHSSSAEAKLFFALVPNLCNIINSDCWYSDTTDSDQASLMVIECIVRVLFTGPIGGDTTAFLPFDTAIERVGKILDAGYEKLELGTKSFNEIHSPQQDLISCLTLTAATLIRCLGVRSLPHLPIIVKPVVAALCLANKESKSNPGSRNMQLATVRLLTVIAEMVPHFFGQQLQMVFTADTLFSTSLRMTDDRVLRQAVAVLDTAIATKIPHRLLVPSLVSVIETTHAMNQMKCAMAILECSVDLMSPREASALKSSLFACITKALEKKGNTELQVLDQSTKVFQCLVLKLSEGQLRRVYTALNGWKNELGQNPSAANSCRREAFWAISSALAGKLRALFMPCLSSVVNELVVELEHGASLLCRARFEKAGHKKRRIDVKDPPYTSCTRVLQHVLAVLERTLRADARQGGQWIRTEQGKLFNSFLEPVVKLFHYSLPAESDKDLPSYKDLVEGYSAAGDDGSVVGCVTALAIAAGDEQLWKPLNHAVLEVAATDNRSEVRHAGLTCLISLMKTLGEEYMVLLPECLPVLSELLEDSNEDIGGLARDCITLAEELIGESLEETLGG